jgi:hypothetical protein
MTLVIRGTSSSAVRRDATGGLEEFMTGEEISFGVLGYVGLGDGL